MAIHCINTHFLIHHQHWDVEMRRDDRGCNWKMDIQCRETGEYLCEDLLMSENTEYALNQLDAYWEKNKPKFAPVNVKEMAQLIYNTHELQHLALSELAMLNYNIMQLRCSEDE